MEKDRSFKVITLLALVLSIISVSLGFAAFSREIVIVVSPEQIDNNELNKKIIFIEGSTKVVREEGSISSNPGTLTNGTWDNIQFSIDSVGSSSSVSASITNPMPYDLFFNSIITDGKIECIPGIEDMNSELLKNACDKITLDISFEGFNVTLNSKEMLSYYNNSNYRLKSESSTDIKLTLTYPADVITPDGPFTVVIPKISVDFGLENKEK